MNWPKSDPYLKKMDSIRPQVRRDRPHRQVRWELQGEAQEWARDQAPGDLHQEDPLAMNWPRSDPYLKKMDSKHPQVHRDRPHRQVQWELQGEAQEWT
jgi:hypothetical protein